jgi:hypothetical protein
MMIQTVMCSRPLFAGNLNSKAAKITSLLKKPNSRR